jgi:hypothetical protein
LDLVPERERDLVEDGFPLLLDIGSLAVLLDDRSDLLDPELGESAITVSKDFSTLDKLKVESLVCVEGGVTRGCLIHGSRIVSETELLKFGALVSSEFPIDEESGVFPEKLLPVPLERLTRSLGTSRLDGFPLKSVVLEDEGSLCLSFELSIEEEDPALSLFLSLLGYSLRLSSLLLADPLLSLSKL